MKSKQEYIKTSQNIKRDKNNSKLPDHFLVKWLKQYKNGWQIKYLAMTLFEMDLDKFFNMFLLDDQKVLFFFTKQFKLRSGGGFEITKKSDCIAIVK